MRQSIIIILLCTLSLTAHSQEQNGSALTDMFLHSDATHTAVVSDGDWFDVQTWDNGVPGDGALVLIPSGATITYDGETQTNNPHIFMIRIDGRLEITANQSGTNTNLRVDTLIGTETSSIEILASELNSGQIDIVIEPYDLINDPIGRYTDGLDVLGWDEEPVENDGVGVLGRYEWDPEQLSLGFVSMGAVNIQGKQKTPHTKLIQIVDGDTLVLEQIDGWKPDDRLVVTSSIPGSFSTGEFSSNDELVQIQTVNEVTATIHIDRELNVDNHTPPTWSRTDGPNLAVSVANLSRNITIRSSVATHTPGQVSGANSIENNDVATVNTINSKVPLNFPKYLGGSLIGGDHFVTQRGHFMLMHNDNAYVRDVSFLGLGRTDKTALIDDFEAVVTTHNDQPVLKRKLDRKNDYNFTKRGGDRIVNQRGRYAVHVHRAGIYLDDNSFGAEIRDNVVWGNVGWGYVQHDSEAILSGNVAYDVFGASFVSETGNETGLWYNNLAVYTKGGVDFNVDPPQSHQSNDVARSGVGFWFEGRALVVNSNTAVSSADAGFVSQAFGADQIPVNSKALSTPYLESLIAHEVDHSILYDNIANTSLDTVTANMRYQDASTIAHGLDDVYANAFVPIRNFDNNEVYASNHGLNILASSELGVRKQNDSWSHMSNFNAWHVNRGVFVQYTSKYLFENFNLYGLNSNNGFEFSTSANDITVIDSHLENFSSPILNTGRVGSRHKQLALHADWHIDGSLKISDINGDGITNYLDFPGTYTDRNLDGTIDVDDVASYGHGALESHWLGLESINPNYNLAGITAINTTTSNGGGILPVTVTRSNTERYYDLVSYDYNRDDRSHRVYESLTEVPNFQMEGVKVKLVDDSNSGYLAGLWREHLDTNESYVNKVLGDGSSTLKNAILYRNKRYAGALFGRGYVFFAGRYKYIERPNHIANRFGGRDILGDDVWSGTLLEFDKKDQLGTIRYAYANDVVPEDTDNDGVINNFRRVEYQTTNEKIVFTKNQINQALLDQGGYYTLRNSSGNITITNDFGLEENARFVLMTTQFTNRVTGGLEDRKFAIILDEKWCVDYPIDTKTDTCDAAVTNALLINMGELAIDANTITADFYQQFRYGELVGDPIPGPERCTISSNFDRNSTVYGTINDDVICGNGTWRTSYHSSLGGDKYAGSLVRDEIHYRNSPSGINVNLRTGMGTGVDASSHSYGDTYSDVEWIYGSDFDDVIQGTEGSNVTGKYYGRLYGFDGDDIIRGGELRDLIVGGNGDDQLFGGAGDDVIYSGDGYGNDEIYGDSGEDIYLLHFNQYATVSVINDYEDNIDTFSISGLTNFDDVSIVYQDGNALIQYGTSVNVHKVLNVWPGSLTANDFGLSEPVDPTNPGDCTIEGSDARNSVVTGTTENDVICGNGTWSTTYYSSEGADTYFGSLVRDDIYYNDSPSAVNVDLISGTGLGGHAQGDKYSDVEWIHGSNHDDVIRGTQGTNTTGKYYGRLYGLDGDDTIYGGDMKDALHGGNGNDVLNGKAGDDYINGNNGDDTLISESGNAQLYGSTGVDTFRLIFPFESTTPVINDYIDGIDKFEIPGMADFNDVDISYESGYALIGYQGSSRKYKVLNASIGTITAIDFGL